MYDGILDYYPLAEGPGGPGGCVSSGVARSELAYSLNKREALDSNQSVEWDIHANCKQTSQTNKQTYIYTDIRNIYVD